MNTAQQSNYNAYLTEALKVEDKIFYYEMRIKQSITHPTLRVNAKLMKTKLAKALVTKDWLNGKMEDCLNDS